jgi:hypothetical protein
MKIVKTTKKKPSKTRKVPKLTAAGIVEVAEVPEGIKRLAQFIRETMETLGLTTSTVAYNSNPHNRANRLNNTTIWRILKLESRNIEDRTLVLLANGLNVDVEALRKIYLGEVTLSSTVRPVELETELWQRLEENALRNRRTKRSGGSIKPDVNNELAALLDKHLPPLQSEKTRKAS